MKNIFLFLIALIAFAGCTTSNNNLDSSVKTSNVSVGVIQKEIKIGMTTSEVAEVLGSPNIVTTDSERREVWIYDKVSSNVKSSSSKGFASLILIGTSSGDRSYSSTQRTLTVIIKFDKENKVRDFSYRTSQF